MHWSSRRRPDGRRISRFMCLALSLAVLAVSSRSAFADCPVEDWPEVQVLAANTDSADGIGGTGRAPGSDGDDDGIGGSGIFGTITAFGSVCVNGHRVSVGDEVEIRVNGLAASNGDLVVGQVVFAEIADHAGELQASSIDVEHVLLGPVTSIGEDAIEVMGERVVFVAGSLDELGTLEVGMRLAVSGLRDSTGAVVASRIDLATFAEGADQIRGIVRADREGRRRVGGIQMMEEVGGTTVVPSLEGARDRRWLQGQWNSETSSFDIHQSESSQTMLDGSARFDVEGYVVSVTDGTVRIGDLDLRADAELRRAGIELGDRVRVRGTRDSEDGNLRATEIQRLPTRPFLFSLDRGWRGSGTRGLLRDRAVESGRRLEDERKRKRDAERRKREPTDRPRDPRVDHPRPDRPSPEASEARRILIDGRKGLRRR